MLPGDGVIPTNVDPGKEKREEADQRRSSSLRK
jgi:hypothetical protein